MGSRVFTTFSLLLLFFTGAAWAGPTEKVQTLNRLRELRQAQISQIEKVDSQLRQRIAQSQSLTLRPINSGRRADIQVTEQSLRLFASTLETLRTSRAEAEAQRNLFDLLMFYIETRWNGASSLRDLLHNASLDAAVNDATQSSSRQQGRETGDLTRFFVFLSIALRDAYDLRTETPREVISFVEDYVRFSTVLEPRLPSDFAQSRSYTNGLMSSAAFPKHPVEAADEVERILGEVAGKREIKGVLQTRPTTAERLAAPAESQPAEASASAPPTEGEGATESPRLRWVPETPLEQILEELSQDGR
jgi:hypothetical protein